MGRRSSWAGVVDVDMEGGKSMSAHSEDNTAPGGNIVHWKGEAPSNPAAAAHSDSTLEQGIHNIGCCNYSYYYNQPTLPPFSFL